MTPIPISAKSAAKLFNHPDIRPTMGPGPEVIVLPDGWQYFGDNELVPTMCVAFHPHVWPGVAMVHSGTLRRGSDFKRFARAAVTLADADYIITWVQAHHRATQNFTIACGFERIGAFAFGDVSIYEYGRPRCL